MSGKIRRIAILGMGLIGSSVARAIRRADRNMLICAHDHHLRTIEAVREYGLCDHIALDAAEAAKGADL
ncbi:MAG: NAD(P)-binding domain-containing protein, partial [Pseudomonadota bacterium]